MQQNFYKFEKHWFKTGKSENLKKQIWKIKKTRKTNLQNFWEFNKYKTGKSETEKPKTAKYLPAREF